MRYLIQGKYTTGKVAAITVVSATKGMANLPSAVRTLNVAAVLTRKDKPDPLSEKINEKFKKNGAKDSLQE